MFNSEDNDQTESFSEAYKSQILNHDDDTEEKSSKNIIIILTLIVVILGLGIFGYKYLSETKKTTETTQKESSQESEEPITPPESTMLNNISELTEEDDSDEKRVPEEVIQKVSVPKAESIDTKKETVSEMEKIADNVKLEIAKELNDEDLTDSKKEDTPPPPVSSNQKAEDTYLEQLAELSKEIDGGK